MADQEIAQASETEERRQAYRARFFVDEINLSEGTRKVLQEYSKIPSQDVDAHVHNVRTKAWAIYPYPCIGRGAFLELHIGQHPLYKIEILPRMLSGDQTYLDLGCAFAQDIRRLVADGVDSKQCYGSDLRLDFLELGYELFNDKDTLRARFIPADIFDAASPLKELDGDIDIIDASSFFHLFNLDEQKIVARRVIRLMKPKKDSLIVGRQMGHVEPGEYSRRIVQGSRWRHNVETWGKMWTEVGAEAGVEFEVEGSLEEVYRPREPEDPGARRMEFSVRRLA